jgi:uncharacterized OB-fold protein
MSNTTAPKPRPIADELSEGYWEATARGELAIQRCEHCGHYSHPPTPVCGSCFTVPPAFSFAEVSGSGRVVTWTVMRQAFLPGFADDVPYVIVVAELDEQPGLTLIGRLVEGPEAGISLGGRVSACFDRLESGEAIPAFTLVEEAEQPEADR